MQYRIRLTLVLAAGLALATAGAAGAADMGNDAGAGAAVPSDVNWTGFYFGVNGGYDWGNSDWTFPNTYNSTKHGLTGTDVGVHAGYLHQRGNVVAGIEVQLDKLGLTGASSCPPPNVRFDCSTEAESLESVRGRLGFARGRFLAYGTGGLAWEQVSHHVRDANPAHSLTARGNSKGWVLGAGLEWLVAPNGSLGIEYLHYGFGRQNADLIEDATGNALDNITFEDHALDVVQVRLSVKLGDSSEHVPMK